MPMSFYYLCFFAYFSLLLIIGCPLSYFFGKLCSNIQFNINILAIAPLFGLSLLLWFGLIAVLFKVPQIYLLVILGIILPTLSFLFILKQKKENYPRNFSPKILFEFMTLFLIVLIAFSMNSLDLLSFGFRDYFPLTNDDTFAYLGHIDQIATSHQEKISITYPSGTQPAYQHAISLRTAVSAHVAGIKTLLNIDTHESFFFALRAAAALISLGTFHLLIVAGLQKKWALLASILTSFSNSYFYALLQQFLSTIYGLPLLLFSLSVLLLAIRCKKYFLFIFSGWSIGIYGITSIESHTFLLLFVIAFLFFISFANEGFSGFLTNGIFIILGYIMASFPIFLDLIKILITQANSAFGGHPGDWWAQKYCLVHLVGIKSKNPLSFSFSVILLGLFLISSFIILVNIIPNYRNHMVIYPFGNLTISLLFLNTFTIYLFIIGLIFFILGKGYALLKFIDYHSILLIPIYVANLYFLITKSVMAKRHGFRNIILVFAVIFLLILFFSQKLRYFKPYLNQLSNRQPKLSRLEKEIKNIYSNFYYALDLNHMNACFALYINRMNATTIISLRFNHRYRWMKPPQIDYVIRGKNILMQDINLQPSITTMRENEILEIIDYSNYVLIDYDSPNNGWLGDPEGMVLNGKLRWFHREAPFFIFPSRDFKSNRILHMTLYPGPDMIEDNSVSIKIDAQFEFPISGPILSNGKKIEIPLSKDIAKEISKGAIAVLGPTNGPRQFKVRNLYVTNLPLLIASEDENLLINK